VEDNRVMGGVYMTHFRCR